MQKKIPVRRRSGNWKMNVLSNVVLGLMVLSIGAFTIFATEDSVKTDVEAAEIYRFGATESNNVSLMFNVYWGTEEVYQILEILQNHNAKATFFIGGCWADDNAQCLKDIHARGHEIGNHGYFHKDHSKLNAKENEREIDSCNRFISLAIGEKITLFAPPSGAYSNDTLSACKALGMKTILWSRDTIDWRDKDAKTIYRRATKDIRGGEFVLMHPMEHTVKVLDDILTYYQSQSLMAVTVSKNLQQKTNS
ncbi:MAG: polysaccharide deacetylase [Clostridiales bacterium]|nr:polysaccharide deacetylase [Clostridiales bacterium]